MNSKNRPEPFYKKYECLTHPLIYICGVCRFWGDKNRVISCRRCASIVCLNCYRISTCFFCLSQNPQCKLCETVGRVCKDCNNPTHLH